jgi:7,8-dihydropterin-6-yl-methyl-4-(beta-D-ribofuranosyl)aminobenzene 5'-phosphate synthase
MPEIAAVDRLEFQVLVDNVADTISTGPPNVVLEWTALMRAGMRQMAGACQCCGTHGLSMIVKAYRGDTVRTMLFDAGPVEYLVEYNGQRLGVDFSAIDAVMLSHGHWDHSGGLPKALELIHRANGGRPIPCYLHPGMFRQRALPLPDGDLLPIENMPTPEQLAAKGGQPIVTTEAQFVLDGTFFVSGEIPRLTSYEKGFPGHMQRSADGTRWEDDPLIMDERFLAVNVKGKGLVVFTACSHAGVVNVLKHARQCFPSVPVHGVTGGFHLSGHNEAIIAPTVKDMAEFDLGLIAPGHCTGWRAVNALAAAYGDKIVLPVAVGKSFTI